MPSDYEHEQFKYDMYEAFLCALKQAGMRVTPVVTTKDSRLLGSFDPDSNIAQTVRSKGAGDFITTVSDDNVEIRFLVAQKHADLAVLVVQTNAEHLMNYDGFRAA